MTKENLTPKQIEQLEDLDRGFNDRHADIWAQYNDSVYAKYKGFRFWTSKKLAMERAIAHVNRYPLKSKDGVRYGLITVDDMFNRLTQGA